jgi:DNA-binding CsgD family transcriptional regulator
MPPALDWPLEPLVDTRWGRGPSDDAAQPEMPCLGDVTGRRTLYSARWPAAADRAVCLTLHRDRDAPEFTWREASLVDTLNRCDRLYDHLLLPGQVGAEALSLRQRQTLRRLLEGDGEKQIAAHLGISAHTVHVYIKALHRHYGVCTRGELLSLFLSGQVAAPV